MKDGFTAFLIRQGFFSASSFVFKEYSMRIAMIQMASAAGDVERNISRAFSMMEEAAEKSDLLVDDRL